MFLLNSLKKDPERPSCDFHTGRRNGQLEVYYAVQSAFEDLQRCATTRWLTTAFNRCISGLTMF